MTLWDAASRARGGGAGTFAALAVAGLAWAGWVAAAAARSPLLPGALAVMAAAGGVVAAANTTGVIFVGVAAGGAAVAFDVPVAAALAAAGPAGFVAAALAEGPFPGRLLSVAAVCLAGVVAGTGRRQIVQRTRQAALIATASQRAEVARREAELASERNRLGRELHDVLAHTLGALSIQLTALDTLVSTGTSRPELRAEIEHSHRLVGEGLEEARQAVRALRDDSIPLAGQVSRLGQEHGAAVHVTGTPRPVRAEVALALYRVAQEALTNAAKHAPGTPASVRLSFGPDEVALAVRNDTAGAPAGSRLAATGGGYGLPGLRERVRLAGGQFEAGPDGDGGGGWQVSAAVPA